MSGTAAVATTGALVAVDAWRSLPRVPVPQLVETETPSDARHFLLVGSDDRDGLTSEQRDGLPLGAEGDFDGQRSDTMIYVHVSEDRSAVSLLSLPRDLVVTPPGGGTGKLTDRFQDGPEGLVTALDADHGLPVNHYVEVSLGGFLEVVDVLGGVTIELDEPLVDPNSGADFTEPGSYRMDGPQALSFVRSRVADDRGDQQDYARMNRQQVFLRAVLSGLTDRRVLSSPTTVVSLVEELSDHVTIDDQLGLSEVRFLAEDLRDVVADGIPMATLPSYERSLQLGEGSGSFVVPYGPGVAAIERAIAAGDPLPPRATRSEAAEVTVALWTGGRGEGAQIAFDTLLFAGYEAINAGSGPEDLHGDADTRVFAVTGEDAAAERVAGLLGVPVEDLPDDVEVADDVEVVVSVGDDATTATTALVASPTD